MRFSVGLNSFSSTKNYDCEFSSLRVNASPNYMVISTSWGVALFVNVDAKRLDICKSLTHKSADANLSHLPFYTAHPAFQRRGETRLFDGLVGSWWSVTSIGDGGDDQTAVRGLRDFPDEMTPVTYFQSPVTDRRFRLGQTRHDYSLTVDNGIAVALQPDWEGNISQDQAPACRVEVPQWQCVDDCLLVVLEERFAFVACQRDGTIVPQIRQTTGHATPPPSPTGRRQCCFASPYLFVLAKRRIWAYEVTVDGTSFRVDLLPPLTVYLSELPPVEYICTLGVDRLLVLTETSVVALVVLSETEVQLKALAI